MVTRDYRPPELIVGNKVCVCASLHAQSYTNKVDMWSLGVTLAEMFHGSPLFQVCLFL